MRTRAQDASPAPLDVAYISNAYEYPQAELQTLLDAPTAELVKDFLATVTLKAQEYDTIKAEKLRVDVELENTVRSTDTKVKAQKAAVAKNAKEAEDLRKKLSEAESAREAQSAQLEQLRSSTSGSSSETQNLRQRIDTLEASNRDTLALVESKSTEKDRLATELSEQHGKLLALRREVSQFEEKNQSLENAVSSHKFKQQSLQQEIDLLKRNSEWHANELQTRSTEHAKFRKERNARIGSLQRELEDSNATVDTLKRTESNLRQRLEEVQAKADEAFAKIASTEEEIARKEQAWKTELDGSKRLASLQAQNAATHKARLQEVQGYVDQVKEDAADEIGRLQAEVETERSDKEQVEGKVAELELKVERLEQQPRSSRPGTPMNGGMPATPGRIGSPFAVAGSARKFERMTQTQYVARINELQRDLAAEEQRTAKLTQMMDDMIRDVENRGPELAEMQSEQQRLEDEVLNFSQLLDESNNSRDDALKNAENWQGEAESRLREGDILRQQLRDLSAQIKILLVEMQSRDQGLEGMSGQERFQLEQAARGELEEWSQNESFTKQLISQRLVIFRDVETLQKQNQELLRTQRILAEQLEGEEARKKEAQSTANAQEVEDLRQQVSRYKDELQATAVHIDSYMKERDMFRRMLHHRGQMPADGDLQSAFGQSIPPATPQRNGGSPPAQTPRSKETEDLNKLLREQQTFFDQYRNEASTDRKMLKDQVDSLGREKSSLQSDIAHWKSQKTLADERLQMLQANYNGLRSENTELQKRSQQMSENAAKQDLRTQQVVEELMEARSMSESLRNENANGKAEKDLWKRIEARMTEDNNSLMNERSRLNKLVADLQNMQNERELSESEARRRLQTRAEGLETELAESKRKLEQQVEDTRKASLRREYEEGQSRTRIDDLVKSLDGTREELAGLKSSRDQLQTRVDELKIELRSAEERAAVLQPSPRKSTQSNGEQQVNGDNDGLSADQQLALEMSNLRHELEIAKNELDSARDEVEQYKGIAQSTEEELANFNETSGQFKEEADRAIAEKDSKMKELEQRVDDLSSELTTTNNELSELRVKDESASRLLNEQKEALDTELARLKDDADRYTEEKKLYQEDLKAQAEIAQQAQQSYEDELLKHAEAARSLQGVRKEFNELRTSNAGTKAEAEAAQASLERAQESWEEQKERFEKEIEEAKRRRVDVDEQNKLLHQQMESFSTELATLRAGRAAPAGAEDEERASTPSGADGSNFQEVIKYLRREKEIVDMQYELNLQEAKRLQQQLDYANGQLEDAREKLAEERRQTADKAASEGSTTKLMQTINELNLYRESSITLRAEAQQARDKLSEKSKEVERLLEEIEPLKGKIGELEGELEGKEGEAKLLQDDRDHWRERTQNIISKYDRVDPAELEEMKTQLDALKAEKERLEAEQQPLREQIEAGEKASQEKLAAAEQSEVGWKERMERFKEQAKEQNRKQKARIEETTGLVQAANAEKAKIEQELVGARQELEESGIKLAAAEAKAVAAATTTTNEQSEEGEVAEKAAGSEAEHAELHAKVAAAEKEASEHAARAADLEARVNELEGQLSSLQKQLDAAQQHGKEGEVQSSNDADAEALEKVKEELATAQREVETLRAQGSEDQMQQPTDADAEALEKVKEELATAQQEVETLRTAVQQGEAQQSSGADVEAFEKVKAELATAQQEVETLRANAATMSPVHPTTSATVDDGGKGVAEQVAEEVAKQRQELVAQHKLAITQLKEENQRKLDNMKTKANDIVKDERAKSAGLQEKHTAEIQRLKDEHEAAIAKLKEEHAAELEKFTKDGETAVAKVEASSTETKTKPSGPETSTAGSLDIGEAPYSIITDDQMMALLKGHPRAKNLMNNNINKRVEQQTAPLNQLIKEKDEEIARLNAALAEAEAKVTSEEGKPTSPDNDGAVKEVSELRVKLEAAEKEKETAVKEVEELKAKVDAAQKAKETAVQQATAKADSKSKLQTNMLGIVQAKLAVVKKAADDTPQKAVKEVWDVANLAKAAPPAAKPTPASPAVTASPATAAPANSSTAAPSSPAPQAPALAQAQASAQAPAQDAPLTEAEKIAKRSQRFGTPSQPAGTAPTTFGQPSQTGAMAAAPRRQSMSFQGNNPQARPFTPSGPAGTQGQAQNSGIARGGAGVRGRGNSGIPQSGIARGGRGGSGIGRGGPPGAGQKRAREDGDVGGDTKRGRGGPGDSA